MKHLSPLIFFIIITIGAYGQVSENELLGDWKVKTIKQKSPNPELRGIMDGFKSATFTFSKNGNFDLTTESKAPAFQMMLFITKNAKWKYDVANQFIKIGSEEDGYSLMGIYPSLKNSVMEFAMYDSEMLFEMEKVQVP